jgi:hypothetical protein
MGLKEKGREEKADNTCFNRARLVLEILEK